MTAPLTSARLEVCRIVREHCTQLADLPATGSGDLYLKGLAERALNIPVEEMASWFVLSDTVLANLRLAMTMTEQCTTYHESLVQ